MARRVSLAALLGVLLWTGLPGIPGGTEAFATRMAAAKAATATESESEPSGSGYREVVETPETFPDEGDLKATLRAATLVPSRGYTPIQVTVQNAGGQPRPVRLAIHSPQGRVTERSLQLGPRERVVTWLLMPADLQTGQLVMESPGLPSASHGF